MMSVFAFRYGDGLADLTAGARALHRGHRERCGANSVCCAATASAAPSEPRKARYSGAISCVFGCGSIPFSSAVVMTNTARFLTCASCRRKVVLCRRCDHCARQHLLFAGLQWPHALHTCRATARLITARLSGGYVMTVKGNAPGTFALLDGIDWQRDRTGTGDLDKAHGRLEQRHIDVMTPLEGLINYPQRPAGRARQALSRTARIESRRSRKQRVRLHDHVPWRRGCLPGRPAGPELRPLERGKRQPSHSRTRFSTRTHAPREPDMAR